MKKIIEKVVEFIRELPMNITILFVIAFSTTFIGRVLGAGLIAYLYTLLKLDPWERYFDNRTFQIHLILISFFSFISLWALGEKMNEGVQSQEEWDQKQKERRRSEELERQLSSEIRRL